MHPAFWELYGIKQGGRNNKNFKSLYYALQLSDSDVVEILGGSVSKSRVKGWLRGQNASRDRGHGRETRFTPMSDEEFDLFCSRLEDWLDAEESA